MTGSREYFAQVAQDWDEMRAGYFTEAMRDAAIALAQLESQAVVADIGTGTGFMIQELAPLVSKVYGFDESPEMLAVAEENLSSFENVALRQAQGASLPLPDGTVDAVFGNMYLHHAPDPLVAMLELVRVLRPGGCLVLTDLDIHDQAWMQEEMADRWKHLFFSIYKKRYTLKGIQEHRTFSVSIPSVELVDKVEICGSQSGRDIDKSTLFEIFYGESKMAPMIEDCPISIECAVVEMLDYGRNYGIVGQVVKSYVDPSCLVDDKLDMRLVKPILWATGGDFNYYHLGERIRSENPYK